MVYSAADLEWLKKSGYPFTVSGGEILLNIRFRMIYDPKNQSYTLDPDPASDAVLDNSLIRHGDEYSIRILWPYSRAYPVCYEQDPGKIERQASITGSTLGELHVNPDRSLCLAPPQELDMSFRDTFSLKIFVEKYIIPYLFSQTHFRKTGDWPWPPAGHGVIGPLEWYFQYEGDDLKTATQLTAEHLVKSGGFTQTRVDELLKKRYKGHRPCLLHDEKEGRRMRNCCREALFGLNKLVANKNLL